MSSQLKEHLEKKGWDKKEITRAVNVVSRKKESKLLQYTTLIVVLSVFLMGNILAALSLLPAFIALKGSFLYVVVVAVGLVVGLLFEIVTRSMGFLYKDHHFSISIFVPLLAFASISFLVLQINETILTANIPGYQNPFLIALVYTFAFLVPYIHYKFILEKHVYSG